METWLWARVLIHTCSQSDSSFGEHWLWQLADKYVNNKSPSVWTKYKTAWRLVGAETTPNATDAVKNHKSWTLKQKNYLFKSSYVSSYVGCGLARAALFLLGRCRSRAQRGLKTLVSLRESLEFGGRRRTASRPGEELAENRVCDNVCELSNIFSLVF